MADVLLRFSVVPPSAPPVSPISNSLPRSKFSLSSASGSEAFIRVVKRSSQFRVNAVVAEDQRPNWWEKNAGPNMIDIHSTEDLIHELSQAGDKLVIVEFYATWCASCRALYPKLCRTAQEHSGILLLKVNFDENKPMCKRLNVRVLPYFHFYRGSDGRLESFSCNLAKFQRFKDAIVTHNTDRCSIGPPLAVVDLNLFETLTPQEVPAEAGPR